MISAKDMLALQNFQAGGLKILSCYLPFDSPAECGRAFKALIKETTANDPGLKKSCPDDLARLEEFVLKKFEPAGHRGLAVFSADAAKLWQAAALPLPTKASLTAAELPSLAPLLNIMDQHHRYGVVLIDDSRARFLEYHLGEIIEHPGDEGASSADPHKRFARAADRLMDLARGRGFNRILAGVAADLEAQFVNHLHAFLQDNLIVDGSLGPQTPNQEVRDRIAGNEREFRKVRESVLVIRMLDALKTGWVASGLEAAVLAVEEGRARRLLVRDGLAKMGRVCAACGRPHLAGKKCLACGKALEPVLNVVLEIQQRALERGCEVFPVLYEGRLDIVGGIAAELRFKA